DYEVVPRLSKAEAGRRGGQAAFARHGSAHMSEIGKLGFEWMAMFFRGKRATGGRKGALIRWLASKGRIVPFHPADAALFSRETADLISRTRDIANLD